MLVIEDDEQVADALDRELRGAGHEVLIARTAAEGVQMAVAHEPDAIVVEAQLPRRAASLALAFFRRSFRTRAIPVRVHDRQAGAPLKGLA